MLKAFMQVSQHLLTIVGNSAARSSSKSSMPYTGLAMTAKDKEYTPGSWAVDQSGIKVAVPLVTASELFPVYKGYSVFGCPCVACTDARAAWLEANKGKAAKNVHLPTDSKARKAIPMATGLLDYFPDALAEVAALSKIGNDQHNPGEPLHWDKTKSADHADTIIRHMVDRGERDSDGVRHSTKVAWRALAQLQIEIEKERNEAS
jgi:hypothetical protein